MVEGRFQPGLGPEHSNTGEIVEAQQAELNTLRERLGDPVVQSEPITRPAPERPEPTHVEQKAPEVAATDDTPRISLGEILTHPEDADPADMQAAVNHEIFKANTQ